MQKSILTFMAILLLGGFSLQAQSTRNDIPVKNLPNEVREVLVEYVNILRTSKDLDECAERFTAIAGGTLVNEDGQSLRNTVAPFSLKKDFNNVKWHANPIKITRVNVSTSNGTGYGWSAVRGTVYKVWIDKADKNTGMPAPISIIIPEGHEEIKTPKVVSIGSL